MTRLALFSSLVLLAAGAAVAETPFQTLTDDPWCRQVTRDEGRPQWCEVRQATLAAPSGPLVVDASPNGGVKAKGADRSDVQVRAQVVARAASEQEARELASRITIATGPNGIRAEGPRGSQWWVSFELTVPHRSDLRLSSVNGPLAISELEGVVQLDTQNGPLAVSRSGGSVKGRTVNGPVSAELAGASWSGEGLDLETTNGPVTLTVPEGYSAKLEAGTTNGPMKVDFPVSVSGHLGHTIATTLGSGGAPVKATTTNGPVHLRRSAGR